MLRELASYKVVKRLVKPCKVDYDPGALRHESISFRIVAIPASQLHFVGYGMQEDPGVPVKRKRVMMCSYDS